MARARIALVYAVPAAAIAVAWLRIERPHDEGSGVAVRAAGLVVLALVPALVQPVRLRVLALGAAVLVGLPLALEASPLHPIALFSRLGNGALEFYDVALPFDPNEHPQMQGAALAAMFAFCVMLALAVARRRPFLAGLAVVAGAGWPGTLLRGGNQLLLGGLILAAVLVILAGLRPRVGRSLPVAAAAGAAVIACALGLSSSPAVAKPEFLRWERWDLYTKPERAVSVSYVWNSDYGGLDWPKTSTTVLQIAADDRPLYWRATTLETFVDENWVESSSPAVPQRADGRDDLSRDPLLPPAGRRSTSWVRQQVSVQALQDRHLVGADQPVAYEADELRGSVSYVEGGTALVVPGIDRGKSYTVWSYVPEPTPAQLARSRPIYPVSIRRGKYLEVDPGVSVPPFGTPGRGAYVDDVISTRLAPYYQLYHEAKRVVGNARDPYAAVVGLESWLRDSGRFSYDEHPPPVAGVPPLVTFVSDTHRGYCQHFAGAMALMLRYLGIPTRVAAGFTSGKYRDGTWTVKDRDAHAWVDVWFRGYGWLAFDPTPGRGRLAASYTASSSSFDATAAAAIVGGGALRNLLESRARALDLGQGTRGEHARSVPVAASNAHRRLLLIGLLLAALLGLGLALYLAKLVYRRSRYLSGDPRRVATACRHELVEFLIDQRLELPRSATLTEIARKLGSEFAVAADAFVAAVGAARFGAPDAAADAASRARAELRSLQRVLRRRLGKAERVAGALSLRSFRSV